LLYFFPSVACSLDGGWLKPLDRVACNLTCSSFEVVSFPKFKRKPNGREGEHKKIIMEGDTPRKSIRAFLGARDAQPGKGIATDEDTVDKEVAAGSKSAKRLAADGEALSSSTKRPRAARMSALEQETPRTLIGGFLKAGPRRVRAQESIMKSMLKKQEHAKEEQDDGNLAKEAEKKLEEAPMVQGPFQTAPKRDRTRRRRRTLKPPTLNTGETVKRQETKLHQRARHGKRALQAPLLSETPSVAPSLPGSAEGDFSLGRISNQSGFSISKPPKHQSHFAVSSLAGTETPTALPATTLLQGSVLQPRKTPYHVKMSSRNLENIALTPILEDLEAAKKRKFAKEQKRRRMDEQMIGGKEVKPRKPEIPHLPDSVVRKLWLNLVKAQNLTSAGPDALEAVQKASATYFEQVADDLATYTRHAGRRVANIYDAQCLFTRQRQVNEDISLEQLSRKYLSREYADTIIDSIERMG